MVKTHAHRQSNPIHTAVNAWADSIPTPVAQDWESWREELLKYAPKRFIVYEPMALLPSGSFTSLPWTTELERHDDGTKALLWSSILGQLSKNTKGPLTHIAVNEGIPLHEKDDGRENVLRSPSGLKMLLGNFGPETVSSSPTDEEFEQALWVSTKQNGIHQTWAPRWTMFSRGNVKEKARLLGFGRAALSRPSRSPAEEVWAVDLYAGIGYFVFCYASLGFRVLCWEINPWSVEGLRRGARANRWPVRVVEGPALQRPTEELVAGGERIVVFLESNERAAARIAELQARGAAEGVRHVNCGFLPTSEPSWEQAWAVTRRSAEAWLHLHENVSVEDADARRRAIEEIFRRWSVQEGTGRAAPRVEHVEFVKTFAPGVWHCVFDVHITSL